MPPEESKQTDPELDKAAAQEVIEEAETGQDGSADSHDDVSQSQNTPQAEATAGASAQKKKSKKKKIKKALGMGANTQAEASTSSSEPSSKDASLLRGKVANHLLSNNPSLQREVAGMPEDKVQEMLQKLNVSDLLTGMAVGGKNQKDMASYKFWQTQPVPRFDEPVENEDGPITVIDPEKVPKEAAKLIEGFEWVTMDLTEETQLQELYELLNGHYVEDDEAMFRFNYSVPFLNWALKATGWRKEWHVGVRAVQSRKLVAFISGVPVALRVRSKTLRCSEINFLCIHKKLRSKRLAPVLIKEITRRCYAVDVWQAIYTGGVVLPTPVSSCRYFHRSLDWLKLYEVGFSPLPQTSTKVRQITKYHLPNNTSTNGLRPMQLKDVDAVLALLQKYLERFDMAPIFTREEVEHWLLNKDGAEVGQVVHSYVVEASHSSLEYFGGYAHERLQEPETHRITDFFSFYGLDSSVIGKKKHDVVRAAYLFYYASEAAFQESTGDITALKTRLNALINDALILAKGLTYDVFNALTLLDNPLFLEKQKFGAGDGQLHYYLYNYRTAPIMGGVDAKNQVDERHGSGVGVVML
ncbi:MAG: glycylpeptide N-tetradecanoyltransferase [Piccolia ochrophora]|nr:MAG: glycylpeptide N-tetradecanoyltransferase [Piccolia ochrophora]